MPSDAIQTTQMLAVFSSRQTAIWAEQVLRRRGLRGKAIQTPAQTGMSCELALLVPAEDAPKAMSALREVGAIRSISGLFRIEATERGQKFVRLG